MNTTSELFGILKNRVTAFENLYSQMDLDSIEYVIRDLTNLLNEDFLENARLTKRIAEQKEATERRYKIREY